MKYLLTLSFGLICSSLFLSCSKNDRAAEEKLKQQGAIREVLRYDNAISERKNSLKSLGDLVTGKYGDRVADYARNLKRVPLEGCPDDFQEAFRAHISAWEANNQSAVTSTWSDIVAIARLHGVQAPLEE